MKIILKYIGFISLLAMVFIACQKNDFKDQGIKPKGTAANFTYAPNTTNPSTIQFTNTDNGAGTTYHWSWGDGTYSSGSIPSHTYAAAGTYLVKLTVTNTTGIETIEKNVQVSAVDFTLTTNDATDALKITVVNKSINCSDFKWEWGNGIQLATENPGTYTYPTSGVYTVKISGKIANSTITSTKEIKVFVASKAQLAGNPSRTWKYHPTEGLSFFGDFSSQLSCELGAKFIFFANNNYQCDNGGSEIVFPNCTTKPARPQTTWTLTRINLLQMKLNIGLGGSSFFGDPTTGPDYTLVNLTDNLLEVDKVNFGFTDQVKYKMLRQ